MNAIEVKRLGKKFRIQHGKEETLKGFAVSFFRGHGPTTEEFWALKNISLEVKKGEALGIIGTNGSGKTTLLRILAGILYPDLGEVRVNGRISTLFELGTGFHPELSGREHTYLNGSILGLSKKEIEKKFDEIVAFSELQKFIDNPLKFYSSGMQVRLAFSIAININPEILLVDEVMAVGDASFQQKSFSQFQEFKRKGATIVFVSHDLGRVEEFCDRVLVMKNGSPYFIGNPEEAALEYLKMNMREDEIRKDDDGFTPSKEKKIFKIMKIEFLNRNFGNKKFFETGEPLIIRIHYLATKRIDKPVIGIALHRDDGLHLTGPNTKDSKYPINYVEGKGYIDYRVEKVQMHAGKFLLTIGLFDENVSFAYDFIDKGPSFRVGVTELNQAGVFKFDGQWS